MANIALWFSTITALLLSTVVMASKSKDNSRTIVHGGFMSHKMNIAPVKYTVNDRYIPVKLTKMHVASIHESQNTEKDFV
ncbi:Structural maintenance of chromosomes protein 4 [Mucor velutinosus]|uniref:Structural maintenance of chromosomes protein 4 n=1 Tax=Mucor velutinosus TaxID=708070 RepID=A0AAN7D383_9FUNG|nr:Structural maintenance of chromosomes protein 4 [Mucor velutinosus]